MNSNNIGSNQIPNSTGTRLLKQNTYQPGDIPSSQIGFKNYNDTIQYTDDSSVTTGKMQMEGIHSGGNLGGLNQFARRVEEPVQEKDYGERNYNQSTMPIAKNYPQTNRDSKMAASAIFPTNSSNQSDFSKFPSFNLGWGQKNQTASQTSSNVSSDPSSVPKNETAKQKRERQLMEIKKHLDQLNKKMMQNAEKNKTNPKPVQTQPDQVRPLRSALISQSAIFDQPSSFVGNTGFTQFSDSKPPGPELSIEKLYAQKKLNMETKIAVKEPETGTQPSSNYSNSYTSPDFQSKFNDFQAKLDKKSEENVYQPTYKQSSFNPISNDKNDYSYTFQKYAQGETKKPQTYSSFNSDKIFQPSQQAQISKPIQPQQPSTTPTSTSTYTPSPPSQQKPSFLKADSSATSATSPQSTGIFKKKKSAIAQIIQTKDQKQQPVDISPSDNQQKKNTLMRRTQSINQNIPELKQFKIGDFIVGKKMGKGQFGEVLLVRHKQTGWLCGLKVMNKKDIKDQDYVGQIARELSIQFYLMHRNIAQLYGYFEDQKNFYLLIEFCTGGQLLQKLKQQRRMNQRDVSIIIKQVCQGIDYIHKQQIIHRDIKPENILFNYGVVKISDFGWAVYRGFGMRKTASGSPLYYPPEIVKGQAYDDKIDVWCIGMMTYECILGKIPFRVYTEMDLGRIVSDEITFPSWVDVTDQAKDFILKTLKKKGDERMQLKQMLRHPFITKHQQKQISSSILQEFRRVLS